MRPTKILVPKKKTVDWGVKTRRKSVVVNGCAFGSSTTTMTGEFAKWLLGFGNESGRRKNRSQSFQIQLDRFDHPTIYRVLTVVTSATFK